MTMRNMEFTGIRRCAFIILVIFSTLNIPAVGKESSSKVNSWITSERGEWRWNVRIAHIGLSFQFFKRPDHQDLMRDHLSLLKDYGYNAIGICAHHYRFNDIDKWPEIVKEVAVTCDIAHALGLKVISHHSAVCANPANFNKKIGVGDYNVSDLLPVDIRSGEPCFTGDDPKKGAVFLCTNNPLHFKAYSRHVRGLVDAGIDALMSDDITMYRNPYSCTCVHCRSLFIQRGGFELPPVEDKSFWMNYENPKFIQWLKFRSDSVAEHFQRLTDLIKKGPREIELLTCNASPVNVTFNVARAINLEKLIENGLTVNYLEPYDSATYYDYFPNWRKHAMDMILMRSAGKRQDIPIWAGWYVGGTPRQVNYCFIEPNGTEVKGTRSVRYLFGNTRESCPEVDVPSPRHLDQAAFLVGLNHTFGDQLWICWAYHHFKNLLPFDIKYPGLFKREGSVARVGLVFSAKTRDVYHANSNNSHVNAWRGWATTLLDENIQFDALTDLDISEEISSRYRLIVLPNVACLNEKQNQALLRFVDSGGTLVVTYETSLFSSEGVRQKDFAMAELLGVQVKGSAVKASGEFVVKESVSNDAKLSKMISVFKKIGAKGQMVPVECDESKGRAKVLVQIKNSEDKLLPVLTLREFGKGRVLYCSLKPSLHGMVRQPRQMKLDRNEAWSGSYMGQAKWNGIEDIKYKILMRNTINWATDDQRVFEIDPKIKGLVVQAYKGLGQGSVVLQVLNLSGCNYQPSQIYDFPLTANFPELPAEQVTFVVNGIKAGKATLFSPDMEHSLDLQVSDKSSNRIHFAVPAEGIRRYGVIVLEL